MEGYTKSDQLKADLARVLEKLGYDLEYVYTAWTINQMLSVISDDGGELK